MENAGHDLDMALTERKDFSLLQTIDDLLHRIHATMFRAETVDQTI
jgi:hypothetical protein